ncbi:MAG: reverse transcriptase domain-containing protein, partial [Promethearchaeota archaeon]
RKKELVKKIRELNKELVRERTFEEVVNEIRKERMKESRERKKLRREEKKRLYEERKAAWARKREEEIVHVGNNYSGMLNKNRTNLEALKRFNLPIIQNHYDLIKELQVDLPTLRWLTYHREVVSVSHYVQFEVPKKTGGMRTISAPKPKIAAAQRYIFENILCNIPSSKCAHGFIQKKSILTNSQVHIEKNPKLVINIDLKDFFPSITFVRVRGLFQKLGYSGQIATLLAMLCTEPHRKEVQVNGNKYYVALGDRVLPQGACTSPALTNIICWRLDSRLNGLALSKGFSYSRYADDITFSIPNKESRNEIGKFINTINKIVEDEGFRINKKKIRILGKHRRQEITGLAINEGYPTISRKWLRRLRAILHNCETKGIESQNISYQTLQGMVSFVNMVSPDKANKFMEVLSKIKSK